MVDPVVFVDADSILFKTAITSDGMKHEMRTKYKKMLKEIERNTFSEEIFVAVKGQGKGFRYEIFPQYKKNRKPLDPDIKKAIDYLYQYSLDCGAIPARDTWEADDEVAEWVREAYNEGWNYVIAHIDKDLDMLPGNHYNYNKIEHYGLSIPDCQRNFATQLLTGDSADGIPGVKGIGPKRAAGILDSARPKFWYRHIRSHYNSRKTMEMNARLLFMGDPARFTYDLQSLYCDDSERESLLHRDDEQRGESPSQLLRL